MTQVFNEEGQQIPCTVVEATPNSVTKILKKDQVGYDSVELGFGEKRHARESKKGERTPRGRRAHKAIVGHAAKAGLSVAPLVLRSFASSGWIRRAISFTSAAPSLVPGTASCS